VQRLHSSKPAGLPTSKVAAYLGASDLLLLPLLDTIANNNIWPSKLNDYLAAGRPIVSTRMTVVETCGSGARLAYWPATTMPSASPMPYYPVGRCRPAPRAGRQRRRAAEKEFDWMTLTVKLETVLWPGVEPGMTSVGDRLAHDD